jgi:enamine deaminase RidA (YjgF/YER057c/UK114 family)
MSEITRLETNARMSRVVIHNGTVLIGGLTAGDATQDIKGQTQQVLDKIDSYLAKAGTDNTRMLSAQIWLKDIARDFAGMNEVWDAWLPEGVAPVRATGESKLAREDLLVEIIVTAAQAYEQRNQ